MNTFDNHCTPTQTFQHGNNKGSKFQSVLAKSAENLILAINKHK